MAVTNSQKDLHKVYDNTPCPQCPLEKGSKVTTTIFGRGAFIRTCSDCGWSVGVDDSVNLCDLGAERWTFHIVDSDKGFSCLKGKNHVPMFIGRDAESLMQSICINCMKTGIMYNTGGNTGDNKDALVWDSDEILRMIFANAMETNSLTELESSIPDTVQEEIAMVVDTKSEEMIEMVLNIDNAEQTESLSSCDCGREECTKCCFDSFARMSISEDSEVSNMNVESPPKSFEKAPVKAHVRVTNLNQLAPGDHIAWDRAYAVWHHAIVMWVETDSQEIDVVHNSGGLKDNRNGHLASVRTETVKVDCETEFLYVYKYSDDECYQPDEVIIRAGECLNQPYNPFKFNCEHFARWCKAGLKCCLQMEKFFQRLKMGSSSFVKFIEECAMVALRVLGNSETMGQILATGAKGARVAIKAQLQGTVAGSPKLFRYLGLGTMIGSIVLSVATEVIFFIYKLFEAKKLVDKEEMSWDDFQRDIVELIFEGLFGLGGGLAAGFGFGMIPYAGVFLSPLGYLLGNWIGRFLGAFVGRLVARRLPIKKLDAS